MKSEKGFIEVLMIIILLFVLYFLVSFLWNHMVTEEQKNEFQNSVDNIEGWLLKQQTLPTPEVKPR